MKKITELSNVQRVLIINNDIIFYNSSYINNYKLDLLLQLKDKIIFGGIIDSNYLIAIENNKITIFNERLESVWELNKEIISVGNSGFQILSKESFIWYLTDLITGETRITFFKIGDSIETVLCTDFYGVILNEFYRLNFEIYVFSNPQRFRCSNLFDTETNWTYNCSENEQVIGNIEQWNDKLYFYTKQKSKDLYDSLFWINVLELSTGKLLFRTETQNIGSRFDNKRGLLVAVKGSMQNQDNYKFYEIIDLKEGKVEKGDIFCENSFFGVGTTMQYLYMNKLYFIDNFITIGGIKFNENPKIGCFDFIKKELVYFKEIPDLKGRTVAQIIVNDDKIYIRTEYFELFVFEEDIE